MKKMCLVYLDDIIVFSKTFYDHIKDLATVFMRLADAQLKLKGKNSTFAVSRFSTWDIS